MAVSSGMSRNTKVRSRGDRIMPFQGERMTCIVCSFQERSNPKIESDWRMIDADG